MHTFIQIIQAAYVVHFKRLRLSMDDCPARRSFVESSPSNLSQHLPREAMKYSGIAFLGPVMSSGAVKWFVIS